MKPINNRQIVIYCGDSIVWGVDWSKYSSETIIYKVKSKYDVQKFAQLYSGIWKNNK